MCVERMCSDMEGIGSALTRDASPINNGFLISPETGNVVFASTDDQDEMDIMLTEHDAELRRLQRQREQSRAIDMSRAIDLVDLSGLK